MGPRIPYLFFKLAGDEIDGDRELLFLVERLAEKLGHQPHNPLIHQNFIEPASSDILLRIRTFDLWIRIRILDPDPDIFVIDLQDASKKLIF